ncbi:MAG: DNA gyrase subunit A, partial [Bacteroidales bacterium]|nr:DNA gyrase subunit A [Bacteroidales bacterium]
GIIAYIDNQEIEIEELLKYIKAPDFPTSCTIYGYDGVREALMTGRGRVVMRGDITVETAEHTHGRERIIINTVPYQVNKAEMVKKIADLVKENKIEGIAEIRDESKREVRVVLELKRDAVTNVVINKLYQYSPLQTSFSVNNVALVHGRPMMLNIKDLIRHFVDHRHEVVIRRAKYELKKAEDRLHIVSGFLKALDIIDEIIHLIRASKTVEEAKTGLIDTWQFSEIQAAAIVDMRLRQLTGLEREKLQNEYNDLIKKIDYLTRFLADESMRMDVIKQELLELKEKYGDERKSRIEYAATDFRIEDTIEDEDVIITISHRGYIKRTNLSEYKVQNRGGKGSKGSDARNDDFIEHLYTATNHNYLLFFTEKGRCFWLRVFEIPEGNKQSKGRAIQNLINIEQEDKVRAVINVKNISDKDYINNNYIVLCSEKGIVKKTSLEAYSRPRQNGINAITIREGDTLLEARLTDGNSIIMLALYSGKAIRFKEKQVRPMGRNATGVRGVRLLDEQDHVIGMLCVPNTGKEDILVVSENGYGKRSSFADYRETNRGGIGVKTIKVTEKTGNLIALKNVMDSDDLMIINRSGIIIRLKVANLRVMGRATQGVRLINLKPGDAIAAVTQVPTEENDEKENDQYEIDLLNEETDTNRDIEIEQENN